MRRAVTFVLVLLGVVAAGGANAVLPTDTITTFQKNSEGKVVRHIGRWGQNYVIMATIDGPMLTKKITETNGTLSGSVPNGTPARVGPIAVDWARKYLYYIPAFKHSVRRAKINTELQFPTVSEDELLAGSATTSGFAGDGETKGTVRFNSPSALALGPDGTLYVADTKNNKIRSISLAGIVDTFAGTGTAGNTGDGGQATAARLRAPNVVAVGPDGKVYIGEPSYGFVQAKVRAVGLNGVIASTSVGGAAGIAFDAAGNMYVSQANTIVKYPRGSSTSVAVVKNNPGSSGQGIFAGDGGEATAASLNKPEGLMVDLEGSLYIVDWGNSRIRKIRNYPPRAALECRPTQGDAPLTVSCGPTAGTFDPNGTIMSYSWSFGGRAGVTTVKRVQQTHTFTTTGAKVVKLTVRDDSGVAATAQVTVTVR